MSSPRLRGSRLPGPVAGRQLRLSDCWHVVVLVPVLGVIVLGLFLLDGALVELVDDPLDMLGHLPLRRSPTTPGELPATWASAR